MCIRLATRVIGDCYSLSLVCTVMGSWAAPDATTSFWFLAKFTLLLIVGNLCDLRSGINPHRSDSNLRRSDSHPCRSGIHPRRSDSHPCRSGIHPRRSGIHPHRSGIHPRRSGIHPHRSDSHPRRAIQVQHSTYINVGTIRDKLVRTADTIHRARLKNFIKRKRYDLVRPIISTPKLQGNFQWEITKFTEKKLTKRFSKINLLYYRLLQSVCGGPHPMKQGSTPGSTGGGGGGGGAGQCASYRKAVCVVNFNWVNFKNFSCTVWRAEWFSAYYGAPSISADSYKNFLIFKISLEFKNSKCVPEHSEQLFDFLAACFLGFLWMLGIILNKFPYNSLTWRKLFFPQFSLIRGNLAGKIDTPHRRFCSPGRSCMQN